MHLGYGVEMMKPSWLGVYCITPSISRLLVNRHSLWELGCGCDRLCCQCEYYLSFKEYLYIAHHKGESSALTTCILSDMSVRFGNRGLAGYLFWEKTNFCIILMESFMSHIILVSWTGMISSSSVSPGIVPYPPERDDGGQIRWVWYPVHQAFKSHSWSNSVYVVFPHWMVPDFPHWMVPDFPPHPLFPWVWSSPPVSHHVTRSCFTILLEKLSSVLEPIVVEQTRHWCKKTVYYGTHIHMFLLVLHILTCHKMTCHCGNQYLDFTNTYL